MTIPFALLIAALAYLALGLLRLGFDAQAFWLSHGGPSVRAFWILTESAGWIVLALLLFLAARQCFT